MVKTETNEMMNNFEKLVFYSSVHMCCVIYYFFHVQLCLQSWSTLCKRKREIL